MIYHFFDLLSVPRKRHRSSTNPMITTNTRQWKFKINYLNMIYTLLAKGQRRPLDLFGQRVVSLGIISRPTCKPLFCEQPIKPRIILP